MHCNKTAAWPLPPAREADVALQRELPAGRAENPIIAKGSDQAVGGHRILKAA